MVSLTDRGRVMGKPVLKLFVVLRARQCGGEMRLIDLDKGYGKGDREGA
jgi:hypothetical protein